MISLLYVLEFTMDFDTNIQSHNNRKTAKDISFISDHRELDKFIFIDLSMVAVRVMDSFCISLLFLLH